MLLTIDIGNTNISLGLFKGARLTKKMSITTANASSSTVVIRNLFDKYAIEDTLICSVVPKATALLSKKIKAVTGKLPLLIGKDITVPIKNLYHKPHQVGQDRLVNAYAGVALYGAPLIVADLGTATTFDIISTKKEYLGGMILPGLQMSLDALSEHTALLPKTKLAPPKGLIGRNTQNSILSGVVYGFASLTEDLFSRIKSRIGKNARLIGTGGDMLMMSRYCKSFYCVDRDLTLKGLRLIYERPR